MAELAAVVGALHHALETDATAILCGRRHAVLDWFFCGIELEDPVEHWIFQKPAFRTALNMHCRLCDCAHVSWEGASPTLAGALTMCEVVSNALQREAVDVAEGFPHAHLDEFGLTLHEGYSRKSKHKR